jgi:hypothetical protein
MRHRTNDEATAPGVYHSDCKCRVELKVRKGDRFPLCPKCRRAVGWNFTRSVFLDTYAQRASQPPAAPPPAAPPAPPERPPKKPPPA